MSKRSNEPLVDPVLPNSAINSDSVDFVRRRAFGATMAFMAFVVIVAYVFSFTPYENFLFSDMRSFWTRALERLAGDEFADSQFQAWPPIYHIFLSEFFRALRWLDFDYLIRLESALAVNILLFSISVYAFQRIAARWFNKRTWLIVAVALYAFGFPAWYFHAFLLSGNPGASLFVMAVAAIVCSTRWRATLGGAILFGLAGIIRPSLAPYGLAFVAFYLAYFGLKGDAKWQFLARAAAFSAVFFSIVFLAGAEVSRISGGRVTGLSANGGLDFFIANSDFHRVDLRYDGWHFFVVVPAASWKAEKGIFYTDVPFYNQGYYFDRGFEHIKRDPWKLITNTRHMSYLFFADMLPTRYDAPGFKYFRPLWDWFKFAMFLSFGLYWWAHKKLEHRRPAFVLFATTIGVTLIVSYLFTGEPRYTYEIIAIFYLLFFKLIESFSADWRALRKVLPLYGGAVALIAAGIAGIVWAMEPNYPPTVDVSMRMHAVGTSGPTETVTVGTVGSVLFPFTRDDDDLALKHEQNEHVRIARPAVFVMRTRMEVLGAEPLKMIFRAYSSWPFRMNVNGRSLWDKHAFDYFDPNEMEMEVPPGVHDINIEMDYEAKQGGFAVNYSYYEGELRARQPLGVDSGKVRFLRSTSEVQRND